MGRLAVILTMVMLAGCAGSTSDAEMAAFKADYCRDAGSNRVTPNTNVTVSHWDHEATTAGHRGTRTDNLMEPDLNQAPPHGC